MANLLHKYSQFSTIHVWVNQGRYLTKTVFAFFCSICPLFLLSLPHKHTHRYTHLHTYTHTNYFTHTHIPLCPKASWAQKCLFCGYKRYWSLRQESVPFLPHCRFPLPKYPVGRNGKEWGRKERKSWYKFPSPAVQAVRNRRLLLPVCWRLSCHFTETLGCFSLCSTHAPPFLPKLLVVTEQEVGGLVGRRNAAR